MNPSMLFRYGDSRLDFESSDDNKMLDVNFWTTNGRSQGVVRLDAKELEKLIDHMNLQLSKMTIPPASSQTATLKNSIKNEKARTQRLPSRKSS